jgi:hypothetical protein
VDVWGEWEFCLHARYKNYGDGIVGATGTIHFFLIRVLPFNLVVVQKNVKSKQHCLKLDFLTIMKHECHCFGSVFV